MEHIAIAPDNGLGLAANRDIAERIAVIGGGPTAVYLCHALAKGRTACDVTVFEAGDKAGPGTPYNAELNGAELLANIAGIEIPPLGETINDWAVRQPVERLEEWGIADIAADDRAFFPRVVLGAWFAEQMEALIAHPPAHLRLDVRTGVTVEDIIAQPGGSAVTWTARDGSTGSESFDRIVLATGYGRTSDTAGVVQQVSDVGEARRIAVLGTSLSAVDAAVAIASERGEFVGEEDRLQFVGDTGWKVVLASRGGVLPEADFWFPMPPEPLDICTPDRVSAFVRGRDGDLDTVFRMFASELARCDPAYAERIALGTLDADSFADAYFAERTNGDPFGHAAANLAEALGSHRAQRTIAWRYAILRMHEVFAEIVPQFSKNDLARFSRGLKRVFTDNYAAVPHLSIARLLAMHRAGVLEVRALGDDYTLDKSADGTWYLNTEGHQETFDTVLDARGQMPVGLDDLPFPTLRLQVCAHANARDNRWADGINPETDLTIDDQSVGLGMVHFLALPYLLKRRPFIQGLVDCSAMAEQVAATVREAHREEDLSPQAQLLQIIDVIERTDLILAGDNAVLQIEAEPAET